MSTDGKDSKRGTGNLSPEDKAAFERRLSDLSGKLGKIKDEKDATVADSELQGVRNRGMAMGLRMASEFVAAVAVGGLIGYVLDRLIGTTPWLFLLFFILGFAAGVMNVVRAFNRLQGDIAHATKGNIGKSVPDDDD
jgi:ATP synthase protein I